MKTSPKVAVDYRKIAETRMKNHTIQSVEVDKKEELRLIEENLPEKNISHTPDQFKI
jgi:hypothetical protein